MTTIYFFTSGVSFAAGFWFGYRYGKSCGFLAGYHHWKTVVHKAIKSASQ